MQTRGLVLVGVAVLLRAAALPAWQPDARPPQAVGSARPTFAGTWTLNRGETHEDVANWRRPVSPGGGHSRLGAPVTAVPVSGGPDPYAFVPPSVPPGFLTGPSGEEPETIMRDLLEPAERLIVQIESHRVTMTDDLGRTLRYGTTGEPETHRLGATEFKVATRWSGVSLAQDVTAAGGFKMSQIFFPSEDGEALFIVIKIEKPKLTPPVKDIERAYMRSREPGPGASPARVGPQAPGGAA